jgi:hypothetical protein
VSNADTYRVVGDDPRAAAEVVIEALQRAPSQVQGREAS